MGKKKKKVTPMPDKQPPAVKENIAGAGAGAGAGEGTVEHHFSIDITRTLPDSHTEPGAYTEVSPPTPSADDNSTRPTIYSARSGGNSSLDTEADNWIFVGDVEPIPTPTAHSGCWIS